MTGGVAAAGWMWGYDKGSVFLAAPAAIVGGLFGLVVGVFGAIAGFFFGGIPKGFY